MEYTMGETKNTTGEGRRTSPPSRRTADVKLVIRTGALKRVSLLYTC